MNTPSTHYSEDDLRAALILLEWVPLEQPVPARDDVVIEQGPAPRRPRRRWAPVLAVVAVVLMTLAAGIIRAVGNSHHAPAAAPTIGAPAWDRFPTHAMPRPVVLVGADILGPGFAGIDPGLADTSDAVVTALLAGQVRVATILPSGPTTNGGYPLLSATAAAAKLTTRRASVAPTSLHVDIIGGQLTQKAFPTDRPDQLLPAWHFQIPGVIGGVYVLAVADSQRYPVAPRAENPHQGASPGVVSADGRELTIPFVAHHDSTDPCDASSDSTLKVRQGANAIMLDVTTITYQTTPAAISCPTRAIPSYALYPGAPNTTTIQLAQPLGNRVVVDGDDFPYAVATE